MPAPSLLLPFSVPLLRNACSIMCFPAPRASCLTATQIARILWRAAACLLLFLFQVPNFRTRPLSVLPLFLLWLTVSVSLIRWVPCACLICCRPQLRNYTHLLLLCCVPRTMCRR